MSIKTLSPYYVSVPLINPITGVVCSSYTAKIYVWTGSKVAAPATPEYVMTKINAANSAGSDKLNISRIVNDFIEFDITVSDTTGVYDSANQAWVKMECYYNDVADIPGFIITQLAIKGYGYFMGGENPQLPTNRILLTGDEFKVSRNGLFVLPLLAREPTVGTRTITITEFTPLALDSDIFHVTVSANFSFSQFYLFVRAIGSTEWLPTTISGLPGDGYRRIPESLVGESFQYRVAAYDTVTGTVVYSTTQTYTP